MRKVLYKKWITRVSNGLPYPGERAVEGTNCWETDFIHEGVFHQWAFAFEDSPNGFGNYTVALIENPDGIIEEVLPSNVKFIDIP